MTSWLHAKSAVVYALVPGDFVAFPSGTGIAHTFLNNTDKNVLLLVGGETPKIDNKIIYPLNPEANDLRKKRGDYWEDHPKKALGPHDGVPRKNTKVVK